MGLTDSVAGPLGKEYCNLFYFLTVVAFVMIVLVVVNALYLLFFTKKAPAGFVMNTVSVLVVYGLAYIQNRLLYNMCLTSA
jgi:hypothetical protein